MYQDLTKGKIGKTLILFALPMMAGNFLQQFYNIADTLIVGRVLGRNALAAVGSAYTLMTFLTSIFLGFSMGAGALFSIYYGKGDKKSLTDAIAHGFLLNIGVTLAVNVAVYLLLEQLLVWLRIPAEVTDGMRPAVSHEPWNSYGAGTCQQFRSGCDGGFRGSGQDRYGCLPSGAGFRKRLCDIYRAEFRRG